MSCRSDRSIQIATSYRARPHSCVGIMLAHNFLGWMKLFPDVLGKSRKSWSMISHNYLRITTNQNSWISIEESLEIMDFHDFRDVPGMSGKVFFLPPSDVRAWSASLLPKSKWIERLNGCRASNLFLKRRSCLTHTRKVSQKILMSI